MSSRGIDEKHQRTKKRVVETETDQIVMTGSIFKEGWFKMYIGTPYSPSRIKKNQKLQAFLVTFYIGRNSI